MAGLLQNIKSLRHGEGNFSFPWGFPNLYPTAVVLTVLLYKAVVREDVSIIFLTCWKSGCTSMLLEFFAAYHIFLCISACKVSACNQTTESWGLIQSHRGCKSKPEKLHMAEMETLVLHRYSFLLSCKISDFHSCRSVSLILKLHKKDVKYNLDDLRLLITYSKYKWHVYGHCPWKTCVSMVLWYCSRIAQKCRVNGNGNIKIFSLKIN